MFWFDFSTNFRCNKKLTMIFSIDTVPTRIIRTLENCVLLTIEGQWNGKFVIRVEGKAITTNRYGYPCKKNQNWRMGNEKRKWANPIFRTLDARNLVFTHERYLIILISTVKKISKNIQYFFRNWELNFKYFSSISATLLFTLLYNMVSSETYWYNVINGR